MEGGNEGIAGTKKEKKGRWRIRESRGKGGGRERNREEQREEGKNVGRWV